MAKSIFKSKTFWLNVASLGATLIVKNSDVLRVSAGTVAIAGAVLNILNRYFTDQPVKIL